jgi:DNA-binding NtrC family response regulator
VNERRLILAALDRAGGNKTRAAELLGLTRRALYSRMERLELPLAAEENP